MGSPVVSEVSRYGPSVVHRLFTNTSIYWLVSGRSHGPVGAARWTTYFREDGSTSGSVLDLPIGTRKSELSTPTPLVVRRGPSDVTLFRSTSFVQYTQAGRREPRFGTRLEGPDRPRVRKWRVYNSSWAVPGSVYRSGQDLRPCPYLLFLCQDKAPQPPDHLSPGI